MFDQHRGLREGTLEAVAQLAAITRNRKPLPVALDDIHLAIQIVAAPPEDDGLRPSLVAGLADLETAAEAATAYLFYARCVLRSMNIETASRRRGSPQCKASLKLASAASSRNSMGSSVASAKR